MTAYRKIAPPAALAAYVRYFGILENSGVSGDTATYQIVADACPGLIFQENPEIFADQQGARLPQLFLHGIATAHAQKTATGNYRNIGVYFRPHAIKCLFGIDASELTDSYADMQDLLRTDLPEQLTGSSMEQQIATISGFLLKLLAGSRARQSDRVSYALSGLSAKAAGMAFGSSVRDLDIPERSLERMFKTYVGIPPGLYFRISRFQHALGLLRAGNYRSLTDVAYSCNYADQSHYIRDFREFSGLSPRHYLVHTEEKALNFPLLKH